MNTQDARPFIDLVTDAEEFKEKFNEDIKKCVEFLNSKIIALICDPDSLGNPVKGVKNNPLVEFSKAKYDIFISVKNLINDMEREWFRYIAEMKNLFIENVEIFLANTKLEVKLPEQEFQTGSRKSSDKKRASISDSLYPILNTITKNISGIRSQVQNKVQDSTSDEASSPPNVQEKGQFSRRGRMATSSTKLQVTDKSQFNRRGYPAASSAKLPNNSTSSESSVLGHEAGSERVVLNKDQRTEDAIKGYASQNSSFENRDEESNVNLRKQRNTSTPKQEEKSNKSSSLDSQTSESDGDKNSKQDKKTANVKKKNTTRKADKKPEIEIPITTARTRSKRAQDSIPIAQTIAITLNGDDEKTAEADRDLPPTSVAKETRARRANNKENIENNKKNSAAVKKQKNEPITSTASDKGLEIDEKIDEDESKVALSKKTKVPPVRSRNKNSKEEPMTTNTQQSPKKVTFQEKTEFSYLDNPVRASKSTGRRRTLVPAEIETVPDDVDLDIPRSRSKGKRKTISGTSELAAIVPPKRLKVSNKMKDVSSQGEDDDDNLLANGNYSDWMSLKNLDSKVPTQPGIYEVKVLRAKKPAYIGFCENLRQKLTLHKLQQNSGHKQLDKFIDRNSADIQIRYEIMPSVNEAKNEVKNRINSFILEYKTSPAYN